MGVPANRTCMTGADFLAWDATQSVKHEFIDGETFAMAGAGEAHVTVTLNVAMHLRQHLAGSSCRTFISDMKLRVDARDAFFYPDVMVTCSPADAAESLFKREPLLLVEVLSPSTAGFDLGEKFAAYRTLPTLREYLVIDTSERRCDLYRLGDAGLWVLHPFEPGETVALASVDSQLSAAALWAEVPPTQAQVGTV